MQTFRNRRGWLGIASLLLLFGCNSHRPPVYEGKSGFRITPPPGWAQRVKDDLLPAKAGKAQPDLPLPPLELSAGAEPERLLVRYDRVSAGHLAWLRVSAVDLPATTPLKEQVSLRAPGPNWQREAEPETLEVKGLPAARVAFTGRWGDQDYLNETVAVRQDEKVYFITASFPASDSAARELVQVGCGRDLEITFDLVYGRLRRQRQRAATVRERTAATPLPNGRGS